MARQVIEDVISFFYLSEPGLVKDQKDFRELVWRFHGATEEIESAKYAGISNADVSPRGTERERVRRRFEDNPFKGLLDKIEGGRRGNIRKGKQMIRSSNRTWKRLQDGNRLSPLFDVRMSHGLGGSLEGFSLFFTCAYGKKKARLFPIARKFKIVPATVQSLVRLRFLTSVF